jgi:hypothetical protein
MRKKWKYSQRNYLLISVIYAFSNILNNTLQFMNSCDSHSILRILSSAHEICNEVYKGLSGAVVASSHKHSN